jgi:hypothetical protein
MAVVRVKKKNFFKFFLFILVFDPTKKNDFDNTNLFCAFYFLKFLFLNFIKVRIEVKVFFLPKNHIYLVVFDKKKNTRERLYLIS